MYGGRNSVEIEFPKLQEVVEEARRCARPSCVELFFKVKGRASVHIDYCIGTTYQLPEDEIQFFTYLLTYQCAVARTMPLGGSSSKS
jgi:hypothetical protein